MTEEAKNILIGAFVIIACTIFVWVLLFLHPFSGDGAKTFRVRFANIDKVSIGTRVTLAGRPIGEVIKVKTVQEARSDRERDQGPVYLYELVLGIDSNVIIYDTDQVSIHTAGLLGERSIAVTPKRRRDGILPREISPNDILYSSESQSVEETIGNIGSLTKKAEETLNEVIDLLQTNNDDLNRTLKSSHQSLTQLERALARANDLDMIGSIEKAFANMSSSAKRFDQHLSTIGEEQIWENLSDLTENLKEITGALNKPGALSSILDRIQELSEGLVRLENNISGSWNKVDDTLNNFAVASNNARLISEDSHSIIKSLSNVSTKIENGEGTLGQIVANDDIYLRGVSVINKVETLMDDINHYGLLFHLDRGWQRQRTKRVNQIQEIATASEFRNYFEEEIDQITTGLSRVSMLMQHAETAQTEDNLINNQDFTKVFAELLRKVNGLQASLKLYNQRITQTEGSIQ